MLLATTGWGFTTIDNEPSVFVNPAATQPHGLKSETPSKSESSTFSKSPDSLESPLTQEHRKVQAPEERAFYLSYVKLPKKLYVGQLFSVTVRVTSLYKRRPYAVRLEGGRAVRPVRVPDTTLRGSHRELVLLYEATDTGVRLPDLSVYYTDAPDTMQKLAGHPIETVRLNPPSNFCGILAKQMQIDNYQASAYDENRNILALKIFVEFGNAWAMHLPGALKEGIDSTEGDINATTLLFYAVLPKEKERVTLSYFNLETNRYERFEIPVTVKRSGVSTQTNLDPQASEFTRFKIAVTILFIMVWALLWYRYRGLLYPLLIFLALLYLLTYLIPLKTVCLREGTTIYLLPTPQSTPFVKLPQRTEAKEMDRTGGYVKIQLPNHAIGWIHAEDLCTP
jgi:hypothetical protein